ncbi:MAG: metallophosphoesterase [Caldilineaceae bacterium]|nr:metallophosphoesterase [Caldilineaceae bacterium]
MFDFSHLPPAIHQFITLADTHYMLDVAGQAVEFDSRRRQTDRAEFALRTVAGLGNLPVIHMGDLMQEFPERPGFVQARTEALAQLAVCGIAPRFVAGNHDVGDKPDLTMPAAWATNEWVENFHRHCGPSWQSWDEAGLHFVILNSQILNSGLPAEAEQAKWLETDLQAHAGQRLFLFLHLPPFLHNPAEIALGHYDNIDEPARGWLLALVERHRVEMLFAAHVHWAFYNEVSSSAFSSSTFGKSRTAYFTVPSVAFTRPGFSELFASPPPPEQGRDDTGKLGFYLVRVMAEGNRVHFVRTGGATGTPDPRPRLLTRTSPDLPASPLGVVLHHPLSHQDETPSIWPSVIRQPVRNDYPLLACTELGLRYLRVPLTDLADPLQRERLGMARGQGISVIARVLWKPGLSLESLLAEGIAHCDGVQVDVLGGAVPDPSLAKEIGRWRASRRTSADLPLTLSCVIPGRAVEGKQHNRAQIGFLPGDLAGLGEWLAQHNLTVERVLCRLDMTGETGEIGAQIANVTLPSGVGTVDWLAELPSTATGNRLNRAAETLFALAGHRENHPHIHPASRLFLEPFRTLDRTMDVAEGLLDRLCNPTPVFHLLRHLNTLLFSQPSPPTGFSQKAIPGGYLLTRQSADATTHLVLPDGSAQVGLPAGEIDAGCEWRVYDLTSGRRIEKDLPGFGKPGRSAVFDGPTLLV